jgi:hypothetical protein
MAPSRRPESAAFSSRRASCKGSSCAQTLARCHCWPRASGATPRSWPTSCKPDRSPGPRARVPCEPWLRPHARLDRAFPCPFQRALEPRPMKEAPRHRRDSDECRHCTDPGGSRSHFRQFRDDSPRYFDAARPFREQGGLALKAQPKGRGDHGMAHHHMSAGHQDQPGVQEVAHRAHGRCQAQRAGLPDLFGPCHRGLAAECRDGGAGGQEHADSVAVRPTAQIRPSRNSIRK